MDGTAATVVRLAMAPATRDGSWPPHRRSGIFQPRPTPAPARRVRAGDRLGSVDVLGVPQEVVAPVDGVVGASLVEAGDAVEYGQELILIEFATAVGQEA